MPNDFNGEPESYLDAVGILSRSEKMFPAIVEELVQPELSVWVNSFRQKRIDMPLFARHCESVCRKRSRGKESPAAPPLSFWE